METSVGEDRAFERLAKLTARLASTARLDEIVDTVLREIVDLGFGAVWMAVLDEPSGHLLTIKEVIDGVDTTHEMPRIFILDMRQPIGHGFRERRMINIPDPDALHIIEDDGGAIPPDTLALPRVIYEHLRGHPFACGPLLGSRGQPVGAVGLSSYRGKQPIPDELFRHGLLRAFMDHLGIAMERALQVARLERLNTELLKAQEAIVKDARIKAVGELAAAVAHDLNNLASIVLMAVSIGMRTPQDAIDVLPRIERATRAIGDLVGRLQRVARAPSAEGDLAHLHQIVEDVLAIMHPILREHEIVVEADVDVVPPVRCDPVQIHQLVLNLVVNAVDALVDVPGEHRRIRVHLRDDDGLVRLRVADTGRGIPPEILPQLFRPFVTSKRDHHLGLGLAAAQASLKHFGGHITGRNAPGGGAVFEVSLDVVPGATAVAPRELPSASPRARRRGSVLAIDDDHDILFVIKQYLEPLGYRVASALGAEQALEAVGRESFDLVLCDVGMPGRSGLDVCHVLRQQGYRGKIVLMTGWDRDRIDEDRRATACDTLLAKPFTGAQLLQTLDTLLV